MEQEVHLITTVAERLELIKPLVRWLEDDPDAVGWAAAKKAKEVPSEAIEEARWKLTNFVLKPFVKSVKSEVPENCSETELLAIWKRRVAEFDAPNEAGQSATLAALVAATLPFDRANALFIMKIDRNDPDCPMGFVWVRDKDFARVDPAPEFNGKKQQFASIASAYDAVAAYHPDPATRAFVNQMCAPMMPSWMQALRPDSYYPTEKDLRSKSA
jgi:hypothetical protein